MNKLYNCHLKEWLQWLTRSSNYRSSLTVNIFWHLGLVVAGGGWTVLMFVTTSSLETLSLAMKHAWMGTSLFWPREGVDFD